LIFFRDVSKITLRTSRKKKSCPGPDKGRRLAKFFFEWLTEIKQQITYPFIQSKNMQDRLAAG
jgi:hypothetical protein